MSIITAISRYAADYRAARAFARTERMLGALPQEIRKDIGYPETFDALRISRHGAGHWAGAR